MLTRETTWAEGEYQQLVRDVERLEADSASRQSRDPRVSETYSDRLAHVQESLANFDHMARNRDFGDESQKYLGLSSELRARANKLMSAPRQDLPH